MSLGTCPSISLAEARKAHELAAQVARGEDPAQERKQRSRAHIEAQEQTFEVLAEDYLQRHAVPRKKASSVREDRRIISTHLNPAWGSRPYRTIRKADAAELLDSIAIDRKAPVMATCQRGGEVKQMRWDQIEDGIWTIPAEVAKNGREHQVPLSTFAKQWIEHVKPRAGGSEWVFPSGAREGHVTWLQKSTGRLREAAKIEFIPHDLRRTGATNLSKLGIDDVIIAKILNHMWADNQVTSIYNRDSRLPEMTVALERWGERLRQVVTGKKGKVVRMRS